MDTQHVLGYPSINDTSLPIVYHILSGSFRSLSLFLLAFSPLNHSLSHLQTVSAYGPHQYLAYNDHKDRVYTTSWANPPSLSSWHVERSDDGSRSVSHINTVPISLCFQTYVVAIDLNFEDSCHIIIYHLTTAILTRLFRWWTYRRSSPH